MGARWTLPLLGLFLAFLVVAKALWLLTDWWWFDSVGYLFVYRKILLTQLLLFLFGGGGVAFLVGWNLRRVRRAPRRLVVTERSLFSAEEREAIEEHLPAILRWGTLFLAALGGLIVAGRWWRMWLAFWNAQPFHLQDPQFHLDISFYLLRLPLLQALLNGLSFLVFLTLVLVVLLYLYEEDIQIGEEAITFSQRARSHLFLLGGIFLLLRAGLYALAPFTLLTASHQAYTGAGFVDVWVRFPAFWTLAVLAALTGLLCFSLRRPRSLRPLVYSLGALAGVYLLGLRVLPVLVQRAVVIPNEIERERPFIQRCIEMTRYAYQLHRVETFPFEARETLTAEEIARNQDIVENIRIWDQEPLREMYRQTQELRPYYTLQNIDVDRYRLQGRLQQVLLAARELSHEQLPAAARRWINEHATYTHGYGLCMTTANRVIDGLPEWLIKDIPPQTSAGLKVARPEIYFGEVVRATAPPPLRPALPGPGGPLLNAPSSEGEVDITTSRFEDYLLVNTKQPEFDHPRGDQDVYTRYQGRDGVPIRGFLRRLAFALRFRALQILLTPILTEESRILIHRHILVRAHLITPFLWYDEDPYLVLGEDGRLYWILDAYTQSSLFPYSESVRWGTERRINYIRNAVKAVVDAYDGTIHFYLADPQDPIIRTYARIFPGLFRPLEEMPQDLRRHLRYPPRFFAVQAQLYTAYHMTDVSTFYNREDLWQIPALPDERGRPKPMEPFYLVTRLPGEREVEYLLFLPFIPAGERRQNMIAWMGARCDPEHYGTLRVYLFPKQRLIYGPAQIRALINQDAEISKQLTLWSQAGSEVKMYSLLVVPIEQSILYVQPLYLRASAPGALPELRRVILAFEDRIAMEPTLEEALERIFGPIPWGRKAEEVRVAAPSLPPPAVEGPLSASAPAPAWMQEAARLLDEALSAQRQGNWKTYGERIRALERLLKRSSAPPTPSSSERAGSS